MSIIWNPLTLSLQIALAATLLAALAAVPLAFYLGRRRFTGKSLVEALIMVPLVLPPTVVGYFIIMSLGARGWLGQHLHEWFGYSIMFRFEGAVLAAAVVALPMIYMPARAAFATVDRELEDIARLMGASRLQMFWHVSLPMARRGLLSGLLLGFARALGEFGATIMVFGWQPGRLTLPISIYADYEQGHLANAAAAVIALVITSLALIFAYNRSALSRQD
jgi:molybdate transport system permease protein